MNIQEAHKLQGGESIRVKNNFNTTVDYTAHIENEGLIIFYNENGIKDFASPDEIELYNE